jgi:hypothetical protein
MLGQVMDGFARTESEDARAADEAEPRDSTGPASSDCDVLPQSGPLSEPEAVPLPVATRPPSPDHVADKPKAALKPVRAAVLEREEKTPQERLKKRHGGALPH